MKRRNFLKAICASPLALLAKRPKRRSGTHYIGPAIKGTVYPPGIGYDGEKLVLLKGWYRCSCGCGELHYSSTGKQPTLVNTTGTSSDTTGKLVRCYYEPPENQTEYPFISREDGTIVANLEDYAVIPITTWKKMNNS